VLIPATFSCPVCGQRVHSSVDPSQGQAQSYVEDCQTCCRPLLLEVRIHEGVARITAVPESD
jgi:hypothetical protein